MIIECIEECNECKGTGVYVGMAERAGFGVVCYKCNGTGKHHFRHEFKEFTSRKLKAGVKTIIETNPGICLGGELNFGGMSYEDWLNGRKFEQGMEMREYTCPAWWYQTADYKKKPDWGWCHTSLGGSFSQCEHFACKKGCWERFDKESK